MTRKQKKLAVIAALGAVLVIAAGLIFTALRDQIVFFYSPTEVKAKAIATGTPIRLGGLVKQSSCSRVGEATDFVVTDGETEVTVSFVGILPDLFRSGQGVIAEGAMSGADRFAATNILAKHDENYMPKEVVDSLKDRGEWQREATTAASPDDNCSPRNLAALAPATGS
ncbi:cytochrome c maturation protein CcmE [Devosia sp.]|uniref:cytochrome c maturation protein CcmE n=1 Tax=Devosia sp. TaxID=1871048 RepID=UPI0035B171CE